MNARKEAMGKREYLELLGKYDAILPRHMECEGSYYQHFGMSHNRKGSGCGGTCTEAYLSILWRGI